jgi:hypothetical protein
MPKSLIRIVIFASILAILIPAAAQAADPAFCRDYAQGAIRQVRGALAHPRCMPGLQGRALVRR